MAKCRCGSKTRFVSDVVSAMSKDRKHCQDVCASPICKDPSVLGIMAPLIYDEIGINLCTGFDLDVDIATAYPTVTNARIEVITATYSYGPEDVRIEAITGRPNCYAITLSDITVQFALYLYDASCRLVDTIYPTAVYLPPAITDPTYDEDTNPTSVELEIFAPYGLSYNAEAVPTPIINFIGENELNNTLRQGVNLFAIAKLLDFSTDSSTATVGLTLVLQSLYYVGYKVKSAGKIDIPKGCIVPPEETDCMRFVAGDLLNLAIKPLDLGAPAYEEYDKQECCNSCNTGCPTCIGGSFATCDNACVNGAVDDTVVVSLEEA